MQNNVMLQCSIILSMQKIENAEKLKKDSTINWFERCDFHVIKLNQANSEIIHFELGV
jgi:hypothetical protein